MPVPPIVSDGRWHGTGLIRIGFNTSFLLLIMGSLFLLAHGEEPQEYACETLFDQALNALQESDLERALDYLDKTAQCFEREGNVIMQAECLLLTADVLSLMQKNEAALDCCEQVLALFRNRAHAEEYQIKCLSKMGSVLQQLGHFEEALEQYEELASLCRSQPDRELEQAMCLGACGDIHNVLDRSDQAMECFNEALKLLQARPGTESSQILCFNKMGDTLQASGRVDDALEHYRKAMFLCREQSDSTLEEVHCLSAMAHMLQDCHRPDEAFEHYAEALSLLHTQTGTEREQAQCLYNMGFIQEKLRLFDKAFNHYDKALQLYSQLPNTAMDQANCLNVMGNTLQALRRYKEAVNHYEGALQAFQSQRNTETDQAMCLNNIGNTLRLYHHYGEALKYFVKALELYELKPERKTDKSKCLNNKGNVLQHMRRYDEALEDYEEALQLLHTETNTEVERAMCLTNIGNTLQYQNRFDEAQEQYEQALQLYHSLPNAVIDEAACLINIASVFKNKRCYDEALEQYEQASQLYQLLPNAQTGEAACLINMGEVRLYLRQYDEALEDYEAAWQIYEALPHTETEQATTLIGMANTLQYLQYHGEALEYLNQALELYRSIPYTEADQARCCNNIGTALYVLQRYDDALKQYELARGIYASVQNTETDQAICLHNTGNVLGDVRRYDEALEHYEKAIKLCRSVPNTEMNQAASLNNMASVLRDLHRDNEALKKIKEALQHYRRFQNTEVDKARCLYNLAAVLYDLRQYDEALEYFKHALENYRSVPNTETNQAACLGCTGNTLRRLQRSEEAEPLYKEAFQLFFIQPDGETGQANCLNNLGVMFHDLRHYDKALEQLEDSLGMYRSLPNTEKHQASCLVNIGQVHACQDAWDLGLDYIYQGLSDMWSWHVPVLPRLTEDNKKTFLKDLYKIPRYLYTLSFLQGEGVELAAQKGLDVALLHKGLVEWATQQEQSFFLEMAGPDWTKKYEELQQWLREKSLLTHVLRERLLKPEETEEFLSDKRNEERLKELNNWIPMRLEHLISHNRDFALEMKLVPVDISEIWKALARLYSPSALLEYVKYEEMDFVTDQPGAARYGVFVLTSESEEPVAVDLGSADIIEDAVETFRKTIIGLKNYDENKKHRAARKCFEAGQALRRLIFDPVEEYLSPRTRLFIAPDADLFLLPFEAMPLDGENRALPRYLLEEFDFIYLNTGRDLVPMAKRPQSRDEKKSATIVSNPSLNMKASDRLEKVVQWMNAKDLQPSLEELSPTRPVSERGKEKTSEDLEATMGGGESIPVDDVLNLLKPIDGAEDFVAKLLKEQRFSSVNLLEGTAALEECILNQEEAPQILQILSHGVFLPVPEYLQKDSPLRLSSDLNQASQSFEDPLMRSFLALAGAAVLTSGHIYRSGEQYFTAEEWLAREPAEEEDEYLSIPLNDGRLTAYEVSGLNLRKTELVALTACNTAVGEVGAGTSVAGLRRAFTAAGAHSMIMAQWEVPVDNSMRQMDLFYDLWLDEGFSRYDAFKESQLAILESTRQNAFSHPWYWAGFIYIGDPGKATEK
ncbi:MAG: tetratricopeptide repeat protein [Candidatus Hydrogenedens sp.]|jgi:tetratricopeptide (TPR) repeat protein|nr:tetratricopeptide repeat protein [Candidatus Hydrogenedens sp.]